MERLNLDDKYRDFLMTSSSWSPDDLDLFEPRVTTFDTPPVTQCSNKAQIYELHGYEAMSSTSGGGGGGGGAAGGSTSKSAEDAGDVGAGVGVGASSSSSSVGFHVRDGPVPIGVGNDDE